MQKTEQFAFTVVIPAHNEQGCIGKCLRAIQDAADAVRPCRTEIIVIANRCTDKTAEIAASYGAVFWGRERDFLRIGGFDETPVSPEDMDFARRLNRLGRAEGKRWGTLKHSRPVTSSRKFDQFGDWYLIRNRELTKQIFTGRDRKAADSFYYHVR